jgi:hypothetical protein
LESGGDIFNPPSQNSLGLVFLLASDRLIDCLTNKSRHPHLAKFPTKIAKEKPYEKNSAKLVCLPGSGFCPGAAGQRQKLSILLEN